MTRRQPIIERAVTEAVNIIRRREREGRRALDRGDKIDIVDSIIEIVRREEGFTIPNTYFEAHKIN